jgi:hypothetical protein
MRSLFHKFDKNGDGRLNPKEFQKMLQSLGVILSDSEQLTLTERFDVDGDGDVDLKEFFHFMESEMTALGLSNGPTNANATKANGKSGLPSNLHHNNNSRSISASRSRGPLASVTATASASALAGGSHSHHSRSRSPAAARSATTATAAAAIAGRRPQSADRGFRYNTADKPTIPGSGSFARRYSDDDPENDLLPPPPFSPVDEGSHNTPPPRYYDSDSHNNYHSHTNQINHTNNHVEGTYAYHGEGSTSSMYAPDTVLVKAGSSPFASRLTTKRSPTKSTREQERLPPNTIAYASGSGLDYSIDLDALWASRMLRHQAKVESKLGGQYY